MIKTNVTIINNLGLHARASAKFVSTALRFQSSLEIGNGKKIINGKSIMGVMTLAATQNTILDLTIEGPDEAEMHTALITLIDNKFDELN